MDPADSVANLIALLKGPVDPKDVRRENLVLFCPLPGLPIAPRIEAAPGDVEQLARIDDCHAMALVSRDCFERTHRTDVSRHRAPALFDLRGRPVVRRALGELVDDPSSQRRLADVEFL